MTANSKIEWCDATWNPVRGCSRVSEGCRHCYAEIMAARFNKPGQWGHGFAEMVTRPGGSREARWTGLVKLDRSKLGLPFEWRKPRRIFVNSTSDLFHETLDFSDIDKVFATMAMVSHHTFLVLTKRPERMCQYAAEPGFSRRMGDALKRTRAPLPNVWLGFSAEDQETFDERWGSARETAAVGWPVFTSLEPLLGPVHTDAALRHGLRWVIAGGESGPGARPMHPAWARAIRDQCAAAGTPFFFKQWGEWLPDFEDPPHPIEDGPEQSRFPTCVWDASTNKWERTNGCWDDEESWVIATDYWQPEQSMRRVGKKRAGRRLDGVTHDALPPLPITSPLAGEVATPKLSRSEGRAGEGNRR